VTKVFVLSILAAVAWAYPVGGWGGFGVTGMMVETRGLNDSLTTINREILGGSQTVEFTSPFLLLGGQGGGEIGIFSIGAWGGGLFAREEADVLSASLGYFAGALEPGISWKPVEFIWLRPSIDLGGSIFNLELREKGIPQDTTIYQSSITGRQINVGRPGGEANHAWSDGKGRLSVPWI
jgi:hypothetical protein